LIVKELSGQYTTARRSYGGFSIELLILYCLGKQLTSKQASKQAKGFQIGQSSKQRGVLLACLLISKSDTNTLTTEFALEDYTGINWARLLGYYIPYLTTGKCYGPTW
jgi:hypothetical protein